MAASRKRAAQAAAAADSATAETGINPIWAEMEANYFNTLHRNRDKEDADLAADYRARGQALHKQLIANHDAQEDVLRHLGELRGEYNASQARLNALREVEDVERRAWFERYRRGGLAYRGGAAEKEGEKDDGEESALEPPAADLEKGTPETGLFRDKHNEEASQPVEEKVSEAGTLANGQSNEIPAVDRGRSDATALQNDDADRGGIEAPRGPELPEDVGAPMADTLGSVPVENDLEPPTESETGEIHARACAHCVLDHDLHQGCVVLDDPNFTHYGNSDPLRPCSLRYSLPAKSLTKARSYGGNFTAANRFEDHQGKTAADEAADMGDDEREVNVGGREKGRESGSWQTGKPPFLQQTQHVARPNYGRRQRVCSQQGQR